MYETITSLPWNLMNVKQQREFGFLMARTQRPLIFTILGFAPLNFESYMSVTCNSILGINIDEKN